jgi:hypothetical protein
MLMFKHVYRVSPRLLEDVLQGLLEEDEAEIGPRFEQQVGAAHSIPDAVLSQKPLNIYFEAKHGDGLKYDQLERHMKSICEKGHPANSAFLIGLTTNSISESDHERWKGNALKEFGLTFLSITYRELLEILSAVCMNFPDLQEVFEDYQAFIGGENLLPDQHRKIAVMLCGQSWRENVDHGVYYEPAQRNPKWTRANFLGVYRKKRVSHIGRILAAAICRKVNGNLLVDLEEFGTLTAEHRERISTAIDAASYYPTLGVEAHRYYLVDTFWEINVQKTSSGGLMGHRYLDIEELANIQAEPNLSTRQIAAELSNADFE